MNEEIKETVEKDEHLDDPENKEENLQEEKVNEAENPIETSAREQGWVPEAEWNGEKAKWRPAKEFVDRGELFDKINSQKRAMESMQKRIVGFEGTTKQMGEYLENIEKVAYDRAIKELKREQTSAVENGDSDKVRELTDEIAKTTAEFHTESKPASDNGNSGNTSEETPEQKMAFDDFCSKNPWYNKDRVATALANDIANEIASRHMNLSQEDFYAEVVKQVKVEIPERFSNPRRNRIAAVEGVGRSGKSSSGQITRESLTLETRKMYDAFVNGAPAAKREKLGKAFLANVRKNSLIK